LTPSHLIQALLAALATLVGSMGLATATAHASIADFSSAAAERIPYVVSQYGAAAVLAEGKRVCGYEAAGTTGAAALNNLIEADMPMSDHAGVILQVLAEQDLGC
jgi:type IV secretory pathway TrbF-like protein